MLEQSPTLKVRKPRRRAFESQKFNFYFVFGKQEGIDFAFKRECIIIGSDLLPLV